MTISVPPDDFFGAGGHGGGVFAFAVHCCGSAPRPGDSFQENILAGGVEGDNPPLGGTRPALRRRRRRADCRAVEVDDPHATVQNGDLVSHTVTLPDKECDYCTLQWVWAAEQDGGSYIGCADIAIKANGQLPNYAALPSQQGNKLNNVGAARRDHRRRPAAAAAQPGRSLAVARRRRRGGAAGGGGRRRDRPRARRRARRGARAAGGGARAARAHRGGAPLPRVT